MSNKSSHSWATDPWWQRALAPIAFWKHLGFDNRMVQGCQHFRASQHGCHLRCGPYAWDLTKGSKVIRISRRHYARAAELAADFDELFATFVPSKAGGQLMLDFSRMQLHTYRQAELKFELAQWPEPEAAIDAYFEGFQPSSDDLLFDIGAECGVFTYVLSQFAGKVVAFEKEPQLRGLVERNVARHALAQVTVARETVPSLAELIRIHGQPAFCRVNLDRVAPGFLLTDSHHWVPLSIVFAARSTSGRVRRKFTSFLKEAGFEIAVDRELGMIWAHPGTAPYG